jgi:hypothetical protein
VRAVLEAAADTIEAACHDHTILRPAWLIDADEGDYEITRRGEPFTGTEVPERAWQTSSSLRVLWTRSNL